MRNITPDAQEGGGVRLSASSSVCVYTAARAHVTMKRLRAFMRAGPIALIRDGDAIEIDARQSVRTISVLVSEDELGIRRRDWRAPPLKASRGALFKYIKCVQSASLGCVTDE